MKWYTVDENHILYNSSRQAEALTLLAYLAANPGSIIHQIAAGLQRTPASVSGQLNALWRAGAVTRTRDIVWSKEKREQELLERLERQAARLKRRIAREKGEKIEEPTVLGQPDSEWRTEAVVRSLGDMELARELHRAKERARRKRKRLARAEQELAALKERIVEKAIASRP